MQFQFGYVRCYFRRAVIVVALLVMLLSNVFRFDAHQICQQIADANNETNCTEHRYHWQNMLFAQIIVKVFNQKYDFVQELRKHSLRMFVQQILQIEKRLFFIELGFFFSQILGNRTLTSASCVSVSEVRNNRCIDSSSLLLVALKICSVVSLAMRFICNEMPLTHS